LIVRSFEISYDACLNARGSHLLPDQASQRLVDPVAKQASQLLADPMAEEASQRLADPVAEQASQPPADPQAKHASQPLADRASERVADPVADRRAAPLADPVVLCEPGARVVMPLPSPRYDTHQKPRSATQPHVPEKPCHPYPGKSPILCERRHLSHP
jgi:hypothetical protein